VERIRGRNVVNADDQLELGGAQELREHLVFKQEIDPTPRGPCEGSTTAGGPNGLLEENIEKVVTSRILEVQRGCRHNSPRCLGAALAAHVARMLSAVAVDNECVTGVNRLKPDGHNVECHAFPDGIPWPIQDGDFDLIKPYPGDHGITYEPRESA